MAVHSIACEQQNALSPCYVCVDGTVKRDVLVDFSVLGGVYGVRISDVGWRFVMKSTVCCHKDLVVYSGSDW